MGNLVSVQNRLTERIPGEPESKPGCPKPVAYLARRVSEDSTNVSPQL